MKTLTWNEFIVHVNLIMVEKGIDPNTEIDYIDVSSPLGDLFGAEGDDYLEVQVGIGGSGIEIRN